MKFAVFCIFFAVSSLCILCPSFPPFFQKTFLSGYLPLNTSGRVHLAYPAHQTPKDILSIMTRTPTHPRHLTAIDRLHLTRLGFFLSCPSGPTHKAPSIQFLSFTTLLGYADGLFFSFFLFDCVGYIRCYKGRASDRPRAWILESQQQAQTSELGLCVVFLMT